MLTSAHRPLTACHVLSQVLRAGEAGGQLHPLARQRLEQDVNALSQALGACEKVGRAWGAERALFAQRRGSTEAGDLAGSEPQPAEAIQGHERWVGRAGGHTLAVLGLRVGVAGQGHGLPTCDLLLPTALALAS